MQKYLKEIAEVQKKIDEISSTGGDLIGEVYDSVTESLVQTYQASWKGTGKLHLLMAVYTPYKHKLYTTEEIEIN